MEKAPEDDRPAPPLPWTGPQRTTLRGVYVAQTVGAVTDGVVLGTVVLYVSSVIGLRPEAIGAVLAVAAATALVLSAPLGVLADAVGLRRVALQDAAPVVSGG